ncbi:MAG: caspase family protein [Alphaproteobacteria bacterium]|nr:caspase family protein [Alphaproteobacteria bacterium]
MRAVSMLLSAVVLALSLSPACAERRLALVVGNNSYSNLLEIQQLRTAVNDANAVGDALARLGFTVIRGENLSRSEFSARLDELARNIQPGDTALFYFAGHGVSLGGGNYLLPSDVPAVESGQESLLARASLGEDDIVGDIQARGARVVVVVLDACRDNPFRQDGRRSVGGARGLTRIEAARGVFKLYSAGIGQSALDRLNRNDRNPNSVFTRVLVPELVRPGRDLTALARDVGREVLRLAASVGHEQQPAYYDQILDSVYLAGTLPEKAAGTQGGPSSSEAERAWAATKNSSDRQVLEEFVRRFGDDYYATLARARLRELERMAVGTPPAATKMDAPEQSPAGKMAPGAPPPPGDKLAAVATPALGSATSAAVTGCRVVAPAYLESNDYVFQYQGGCRDGLAEGTGKAMWTLRHASESSVKVTWEGRFHAGIYLPDPPGIVSARKNGARNSWGVIFDLGALPAQPGVPAATLKVAASSDLTNYPDPCIAASVYVTNVPMAVLVSDGATQAVMAAAVDKLKTRCGDQLAILSRSNRRDPHDRTNLSVQVVTTAELEDDRWGNPGPVVAEAMMPLAPTGLVQRYSNRAGDRKRQEEQQTKDREERQFNAQRLRAFFQAQQATGWAELVDIGQNPFRYANGVVVTAIELDQVISRNRALVRGIEQRGGTAVLDGSEVAQWRKGGHLVALRVIGRMKEGGDYGGVVRVQLVGSESCTEYDCSDWLKLPVRLRDGQMP